MGYELDTAAQYRMHAKELRDIAEFDKLEETRRLLIRVAVHFEKMALTMEELHAMRQPPPKSVGKVLGEHYAVSFERTVAELFSHLKNSPAVHRDKATS